MTTTHENPMSIRIGTTTAPSQIYRQFHLTDRIFRRNLVHIGGTTEFRNRFATEIISRWHDLKDQHVHNRAVVVIDPTGALPEQILQTMSPIQAREAVHVDLNHPRRPTDLNLMNPRAFPNRDQCVDAIITTYRDNFELWGYPIETLLRWILSAIYNHNAESQNRQRPMNLRDAFDIISELRDLDTDRTPPPGAKINQALAYCTDPRTIALKDLHLGQSKQIRNEIYDLTLFELQQVETAPRWGPPLAHGRSLHCGITQAIDASGTVLISGGAPRLPDVSAELACNWAIRLIDAHVHQRDPDSLEAVPAIHLVCQHFTRIQAAPWERMHHDLPRYGCHLFLSTGQLHNEVRNFEHIKHAKCIIVSKTNPDEAANTARFLTNDQRVKERLNLNLLPEDQAVIRVIDHHTDPALTRVTIDIHKPPTTVVRTITP